MYENLMVAAGILLGLGAFGQLIRGLLGAKKHAIENNGEIEIKWKLLGLSLLIGGCVGVIAGLAGGVTGPEYSALQVLAIISSGYAGGDALEGLLKKRT